MHKLLTLNIAAVALSAAAVGYQIAQAPPAKADPNQYLIELAYDGITSPGGSPVLLDWGYRVCNDQRAGASMAYSASNIDAQTNLDYFGSMQVVQAAKLYLC